jgi:hypothetical protein
MCPAISAGQEMRMMSNMKWILALGVGIVGGWAARSISDSPQGAGVKLLEIAMKAKERVGRWVALEGERLDDMLAEARSKAEPDISRPNGAKNESGHKGRSGNKRVVPGRRGPRLVKTGPKAQTLNGEA